MKRIAVAFAVALLLCGCKADTQFAEPMQLVETQPRELVFLVSDQFDSEVVRQVDLFADRVSKISNGRLTVKVLAQVPDVQELVTGKYDLALMRNIQLSQICPSFSTFSLPFLYDGQKHMSAVLNKEEMLFRLNDKIQPLGIRTLAALYFGGYTMVSDLRNSQVPADFEDRVIALRTNSTEKLSAFDVLKTQVLPYSQDSLAGLLGTRVDILPENPRELTRQVTIDTVEVSLTQALTIPQDSRPIYITNPGHLITPIWLVVGEQTWNSLSEYEQAVLSRAQAALVSEIDDFFAAKEQEAAEILIKQGATFTLLERDLMVDAIYNRSEAFVLPDYFDFKLYTLTQAYS